MPQEDIDRHLLILGLFYATNNKAMTAEGLYRQALDKMREETSYNKAMGLNLYGRLILKHHEKREQEATKFLKASEEMMRQLPYWYDKMSYIFLPEFDLD
mmetsp:Transcript_28863/g.27758  ORF Transcript_28863/g.27758 Transcript_28863/m.27758 type:complete len:100 (+) Transcript_28863:1065-1364(+)